MISFIITYAARAKTWPLISNLRHMKKYIQVAYRKLLHFVTKLFLGRKSQQNVT